MSPALLGALRTLGVVLLMALLTWLGNAANLNGVFSASIATVISMVAMAIEHSIEGKTGNALFGAVRTRN